MTVGAPGGAWIGVAILQVLHNVLDWGVTMQEAVSAPRFSALDTGQLPALPGPDSHWLDQISLPCRTSNVWTVPSLSDTQSTGTIRRLLSPFHFISGSFP
jgi:gamma-glutamyltranspeptidase